MPSTDPQLLNRYTDSGDQAAFTELVTRHLPLVRGILHRGTNGNPELVDDLAMQVFATLAQKSKQLKDRATIGGWLVITARNKAAEAMRSDAIRKKYMDRLATEPTNQSTSDLGHSPQLDSAIAALPEPDRQAVLLHFYEGLPYREVGNRLGKKEDATRKQVNKALETMGRFLKSNGSTITTTAITSGLAAYLTPSATASTAATPAAIAKQALTLSSNTPLAIGAIIKWSLAAIIIFTLSSEIGKQIARGSTPEIITSTHGKKSTSLTAIQRNKPANQVLSNAIAARLRDPVPARLRLAIDLWDERKTRATAYYEHTQVMQSFLPEECKEALDLMDSDYADSPNRHRRMCDDLLDTMFKNNPRSTAEHIMQKRRTGGYHWQNNTRINKITGLWGWGRQDSAATREWLQAQDLPDKLRFQLIDNLIRSTSYTDPKGAIELLLELPPHLRNDSYGMLQSMDYPGLHEPMIQQTAQVADETERANIFRRAILPDIEDIPSAYAKMNFTSGDAIVPLIDAIIAKQTNNGKQPNGYPDALSFAIEKLPEQAVPHLLDRHVRKWLKASPDAAEKWLANHQLTTSDVTAATTSFRTR